MLTTSSQKMLLNYNQPSFTMSTFIFLKEGPLKINMNILDVSFNYMIKLIAG